MSVSNPRAEAQGAESAPRRAIASYVALGDSFTAGRGSVLDERWADRIAAGLRAANSRLSYANLAVDGATSADVLDQLPAAIARKPDLITVICGANDVLLATRPDVASYEERFSAILERLLEARPAAAIVTATAPEIWHFLDLRPRTKARLIAALFDLNAITRTVAARYGVPCLLVAGHPGLRERDNFCDDGLHPSPLGHERAAREIADFLSANFGIHCDLQGGDPR
jgi:lysophospholipase L1-like esterase